MSDERREAIGEKNEENSTSEQKQIKLHFFSDIALPPTSFPIYDTLGRAADEERLSQLQIEAALVACSAHCNFLPASATGASNPALAALGRGPRLGFLLGDGAGVGKGSIIAAMLLDSLVRFLERVSEVFWKRFFFKTSCSWGKNSPLFPSSPSPSPDFF